MDKKVHIECAGKIESILQWNNAVYVSIRSGKYTNKYKLPRACCNPTKLYIGDYVKLMGKISEYSDSAVGYTATLCFGSIQKLHGRNKPRNDKPDSVCDFCFVGTILEAIESDEFYKIKFKEATEDEDIHTIYMPAWDFNKAMETYDFRRLIKISGKSTMTSHYQSFLEESVSNHKNYATSLEYI